MTGSEQRNVYCSKGANKVNFLKDLGSLAGAARPCFIVGDFNINYLSVPKDPVVTKILACGFQQIVQNPTHVGGGLLDHVYTKRITWDPCLIINYPYYTDHGAVSIVNDSN